MDDGAERIEGGVEGQVGELDALWVPRFLERLEAQRHVAEGGVHAERDVGDLRGQVAQADPELARIEDADAPPRGGGRRGRPPAPAAGEPRTERAVDDQRPALEAQRGEPASLEEAAERELRPRGVDDERRRPVAEREAHVAEPEVVQALGQRRVEAHVAPVEGEGEGAARPLGGRRQPEPPVVGREPPDAPAGGRAGAVVGLRPREGGQRLREEELWVDQANRVHGLPLGQPGERDGGEDVAHHRHRRRSGEPRADVP